MLVLSFKRWDEVVLIHPAIGEIRVQLLERRGDKQRIGFTADKSVEIWRKEVFDRIAAGEKPRQE